MHAPVARTLLEFLVQRSDRSIEEHSEAFTACARKLGERVGLSPRQLTRWMAGETHAARPAARRVAKVLWGHDFSVLVGPPGGLGDLVPASLPSWPRSRAHEHAAGQAVETEVAMAAQESARFAQFAGQNNLGPHTVEQFQDDIERIVTNNGNRPVYPTFIEVRQLRNRAFELLEGRQRPDQTRDLYLIAGILCAVLGEASHDLDLIPAAKTQCRTAFMCGELAGSNWLRAHVRAKQSMIANFQDRPRVAADLAADGWQYVPENGSAAVRVAAQLAVSQARLHDERGTEDALGRAEQARERVVSSGDLGGIFAYGTQSNAAARCRLLLGGPDNIAEAERLANEAVEHHEAVPREARELGELGLARLTLATSQLEGDNLEGAAANLGDVLNLLATRPSKPVVQRLKQIANVLDRPRYRDTALALDLHDQIAGATAPVALPKADI